MSSQNRAMHFNERDWLGILYEKARQIWLLRQESEKQCKMKWAEAQIGLTSSQLWDLVGPKFCFFQHKRYWLLTVVFSRSCT